jgi:serine/threonine protein kinase/Tol biopolymer transport system component
MENRETIAEQLFGDALQCPPEKRSAFLDAACRGMPQVRHAVEDLLAENDRLSGFLSASPWRPADQTGPGESPQQMPPGMRLGRYSILEKLGAGGMGVVYRARDEKLERLVALKILTPGVLTGQEARRHFRREALALAKLNHPQIAAVYDADEQDGTSFIVMELVEGESLGAKLCGGALPLQKATAIALQVAEALEEAHEQGVIHRDLKPANVMITPKGQAKVLDFGLAKVLARSPDATLSLAETGGVMGTPFYMSPEQALGRSLDARTDLWSLGVLYYECLTGIRPFTGDSNLAIMQAITAQPLPAITPDVPGVVEQIVARATEKDPELRYQRAREVAVDLRRAMRDLEPRAFPGSGTSSTSLRANQHAQTPHRRTISATGAAMGAATMVALLALAWFFRPTVPPPRVTGMRQLTHDGKPKWFGGSSTMPLFTDGSRLYFMETNLSDFTITQVSTVGGESEPVPVPFPMAAVGDVSSAQSKMLLFKPLNAGSTMGTLWTMPLPAGEAQQNGNLTASDAAWAPDGASIYYSLGNDLWIARDDGSEARKILTTTYPVSFFRFSHDGRRIRFDTFDEAHGTTAQWEAGADGSRLRPVLPGWDACCGSWTADGKYFVFVSTRGGAWNLWALREKTDWWRRSNAEPVQLTVGQTVIQSPLPSMDGKSIFFLGSTPRAELVRYDLQKRLFVPYLPGLSATDLAFSRDGSRMAWVSVPEGALWESNADGSNRHELTFAPMQAVLPRWSPDGTEIAFTGKNPEKPAKLYVLPAAGGIPQQVTTGPHDDGDPSWSPAGDALAFGANNVGQALSEQIPIQIVDLRSRTVTTLPASSHYFSPRWSPDGRWLIAIDNETYALELYDFSTRSWEQLTKEGAGYPSWTPDGRCVLYNVLAGPDAAKLPYYRICLADRKPQLLVNLSDGGQLVSGTFNYWTGITPDGSILGTRDISIEEVYALDVELR